MADFTEAIERIVAGLEKRNRLLNPQEREIVAYHEMGHALVALALPGTDPVHKVSIIPRGVGALGYTIQRPTEDRFLMTREELENKMAVLLGGRAAEELVFGELSTGAPTTSPGHRHRARHGDALRHGRDARPGRLRGRAQPASSSRAPAPSRPTAATARRPRARSTSRSATIVERIFERTVAILQANRGVLERCARDLLEKETLDEPALKALTRDLHRYDAPAQAAAE